MATFTIDLLTGRIYLFTGDFTGSGSTPTSGSTYPQVNVYSSLPPPAGASGEIYVVRNAEGTTVLDFITVMVVCGDIWETHPKDS